MNCWRQWMVDVYGLHCDVYELMTSLKWWRLYMNWWRLWARTQTKTSGLSFNPHEYILFQGKFFRLVKRPYGNSKKNYNIFWNSGFCKVCWLSDPEQTTSRETDFKYFSHIKALNSKCIVCSERRCIVVQKSEKSSPWLFFPLGTELCMTGPFLSKKIAYKTFFTARCLKGDLYNDQAMLFVVVYIGL